MTDEINVLSRTQVINVEPSSGSVSIINAGPAGPGGWSDWVDWVPKMAAINISGSNFFVEPNYGDPEDETHPSIRFGKFRTNGPEVHARAIILLGNGSSAADVEDPGDSDYRMYLSLPLPCGEVYPEPSGGYSEYLETVQGYDSGYGYPFAPILGTATWAAGDNGDDYYNVAHYASADLTLPPHTPEAFHAADDLTSWVCAVTSYFYGSGYSNDNAGGPWLWSAFGGGNPVPYPYMSEGFQQGTQIAWTARYFREEA